MSKIASYQQMSRINYLIYCNFVLFYYTFLFKRRFGVKFGMNVDSVENTVVNIF